MYPPATPGSPWLGEVIPAAIHAITDGEGPSPFGLPKATSAIVILVDGLGLQLLDEYRGHARTLRSLLREVTELQTCLPSTTAAALTSFATGALPGETRMVGYSVRHGRATMNLLKFALGVDADAWQPVPTFFSRLSGSGITPTVITSPKFAGSGLTQAAFRGARFVGRLTLAERFREARRTAQTSPSLVYLYWSEVDHAGHGHGPGSEEWLAQLEEFDRELGLFLRDAPKDTAILITGDHGMVRVDQRVDIASIPQLSDGVELIAGEGRAVHVHAREGAASAVRARWEDHFGDEAVVVPPSAYPSVIGEGPGGEVIGDALVLPGGRFVIVDSRTQSKAAIAQRGVHGSFTDAEVLVPLLVAAP